MWQSADREVYIYTPRLMNHQGAGDRSGEDLQQEADGGKEAQYDNRKSESTTKDNYWMDCH